MWGSSVQTDEGVGIRLLDFRMKPAPVFKNARLPELIGVQGGVQRCEMYHADCNVC